ncbi:hypothetical protein WR25_06645 [Diploscapter pachys]|uniref:GP-PDE domain-containing protein n=1 Tax=Diploscapter pachys TaxID=2018661 RepID=A0A2A2JU77_9BILA|nr:hypothetical protein WR25_06645 [Diploscapter pachys]
MANSQLKIHFRVRSPHLHSWERIHVVGSLPALGSWNAIHSFPLQLAEQRHSDNTQLWTGDLLVSSSVKEVRFRYLVVHDLDPCEDVPTKLLIVQKWESQLQSRVCLPHIEQRSEASRAQVEDVFGAYDGKRNQISDGWILHDEEQVVHLRIYGEAMKFYKNRYRDQSHRLKIVPFDKDSVDESERADPVLPDVPSFSNTELSVLTRVDPIYGDQYQNGSIFRNNIDYLVFRTRTVSIQHLAFRIEMYTDETRFAMAYALPATLPDTYGKTILPLISTTHQPIGQIEINYMIAKRFKNTPLHFDLVDKSWGKYWRKRKNILEIGHRGMGKSYTGSTIARENTIHSLNAAANRGCDYVEFDVQSTKDAQVIIYHDFHLMVHVAGRSGKESTSHPSKEERYYKIAVKDLTMAQLNLLHFEHVEMAHEPNGATGISVTPSEAELLLTEHHPFPTLVQALQTVDQNVGFNIEIKYPMYMKDGSHECEGFMERNAFCDTILQVVSQHASGRRIVFSCFDPDICVLISQKQHYYPVLFLVVGATTRYMPFQDIRSDCSRIAVHFAAPCKILGVNFHSEELLKDQEPLKLADRYGLVKFVWGDDLDQKEVQQNFKKNIDVDALIYDRIGMEEKRENIFVVEKQSKEALFSASSPAPAATPKADTTRLSNKERKDNKHAGKKPNLESD